MPAIVFAALTLFDHYIGEQRLLAERLTASAIVSASNIDTAVEGKLSTIALLADLRGRTAPDWPADLASLLRSHPDFVTALATDADGQVIAVAPPGRLPTGERLPAVSDRDYFLVPRATVQPYVSDAFRGRGLGSEPLVAVAAPIVRDTAFAGVVEGSIRADTLVHEGGRLFVERGYQLAIVDRAGGVIFATPGLGLAFLDRWDLDARFGPVPEDGRAQAHAQVFPDGGDGFLARVPMRSGWTFVLAAPRAPLRSAVLGRGGLLLVVLAMITGGVLLASWLQMRQLTRGTRTLLGVLSGLAPGERPSRERLASMPEELAPVAQAIDELSERLDRAYAEEHAALLREQTLTASLRELVESREREIAQRTDDLRRAVAELDRLSRTDPLTGALNVRGLDAVLEAAGTGEADTGFGVVALDIDHFKAFNDRYGHPAGDTALKRAAGAVRSALRGVDDHLARIGGEEFVILLPAADLALTRCIGERIRAAVRDAGIPHADGIDGVLTVSLGMALAASPAALRDAMARADQALYRAKRAGRDRVAQ